MHAVLVNVTLKDADKAEAFLREQLVPRVSQAPGLVKGFWARSDDGSTGSSMVVFDSEEGARAMAEQVRGEGGPPAEFATVDSVEVREVVAEAG